MTCRTQRRLGYAPYMRVRAANVLATTPEIAPPVRLRDWLKLFVGCGVVLASIVYGLPLVAAVLGVAQ